MRNIPQFTVDNVRIFSYNQLVFQFGSKKPRHFGGSAGEENA